ncbi:hypothetical protein ACH5RR_034247 [Cinchona calisaya]|uniref:Uncharacterized protein n=1 Tax=Cinchona calisaya TaxID=153742 RepID=A0ABD2YBM8_9GENT
MKVFKLLALTFAEKSPKRRSDASKHVAVTPAKWKQQFDKLEYNCDSVEMVITIKRIKKGCMKATLAARVMYGPTAQLNLQNYNITKEASDEPSLEPTTLIPESTLTTSNIEFSMHEDFKVTPKTSYHSASITSFTCRNKC